MAKLFNVDDLPDYERTYEKYNIKDYKDVFYAVGEITKLSQEWERDFKDYIALWGADIKNYEISTLSKNTRELKKKGFITEEDELKLTKIIKIRNYVEHEFFIKNFNGDYKKMNDELNDAFLLICEGIDYFRNIKRKKENDPVLSPTILD